MWSSSSNRQINYGIASEMGMVGLRDLFVVTPASFHQQHQEATTINFDPHSINASNTALGVGVGVGVIPLLTAGPCLAQQNIGNVDEDLFHNNRSNRGGSTTTGAIHLWQNQQQPSNNFKKPAIFDHSGASNLLQGGSGGGGIGSSASTSITTCQDCGNQAKKDCSHRRCRTCCKSRGFDCSTHVKSTWVPAARRRERQLMGSVGATAGSTQSISSSKKPKLSSQTPTASHTSTSNTTPRSFDTGSSHQDAGFKESLPGQVRAPAVFRCVRVTSVDDGEDEYAYQAMVKIRGHVFKGLLYNQGVEGRDGFPNISDLHLGGGAHGGGRNGASLSSPMLDPSDVYAVSTGGLLGGSSTYGNPIN